MSRLNKLVRTFSTVKSSWDAAFLRNIDLGVQDDVMGAPYSRSDLVYVCITTTARAISQVPLVVEQNVHGKYEPVGVGHPWQQRLNSPNYLMDKYKFIESIVGHFMLDGHVWLVPFPLSFAADTPPDSIWVTSKSSMSPIRGVGGHLTGWKYNPTSSLQNAITLSADEVVSIWMWDPSDPIMGLSPLEAGRMSITTDYKAAMFNSMFFKNGASASGVLSTTGKLSAQQFSRIKEQLDARHTGVRDANKMMVLEQGLSFSQTTLNHRDMEFYNLRRFDQERILQIFGMKKAIISVTDDINYATAKEQRKEWWQDTNLPIMRLIMSAFNFFFFPTGNYRAVFDVSSVEALHEDYSEKVGTALDLSKLGYTANEINERLELGFKAEPWRDYAYIPISVIPVGSNAPVEPAALDYSVTGIKNIKLIESKSERDLFIEAAWKGFMRQLGPLETRLESHVKRIFFQMRKQTLKLLYQKSVGDASDEQYEKEKNEIAKTASRVHQDAIITGAAAVSSEIGIAVNLDLNDPLVIEYLMTRKSKVKGVVDTIKRQINGTLAEGIAQGESIDEMAERVKGVFNAATHRAKTIARTEVVGSSNFGRHTAIKQTGFGEVQWFTAMDERVRVDHAVMQGAIKKVGVPWIVGGSSLMYPGDYNGPAAETVNCRCIEVVVPGSLDE